VVGVLVERQAHFRREYDGVAPAAGERLADDLLRLPVRVDVRGVDEIDPRVQRLVDDPDRRVVIGLPAPPNIIAPETQFADGNPGASKGSVVHDRPFSPTALVSRPGVWVTLRA